MPFELRLGHGSCCSSQGVDEQQVTRSSQVLLTRSVTRWHRSPCTLSWCRRRTEGPRPAVVRNVIQSFSRVLLFATPRTAARQASLSIIISPSLLKFMSTESVMPSNHLILCRPLPFLPSIFPSSRVFSNESALMESLRLEKKTTVSKALAESSDFGEDKTEL